MLDMPPVDQIRQIAKQRAPRSLIAGKTKAFLTNPTMRHSCLLICVQFQAITTRMASPHIAAQVLPKRFGLN
ncbi:hypothetical protein IT41_04385 [Paracoccus halophilus]|uniref:Uncharacterized protein n=1 Tax=Paracoccus halophilus TaxID=376733 RepID=A0A099F6N9_9RHOB|nr:hypothetical protein IT41_04385 [Paracoccus halophilus]